MFWRNRDEAIAAPEAPPEMPAPAVGETMRGAALEAASRQWYRDQYRRMVSITLIAMTLTALSLALNGLQLLMRPRPVYVAVTPDFRLKELPTLSEPVVSDAALLNWVTETVADTLTLDFKDWRPKLIRLREAYDADGFEQLVRALTSATGFVTLLEQERLVSAAVVQSPPVMKASGELGGALAWQIEFPVDVGFESSKGQVNTQRLLAQVVASRADTLRVPRGVVIRQLVLKPR